MTIIKKHKTVTKRGTWQIVGIEGEALGNRYWVSAYTPQQPGHMVGLSRTYPTLIDLLNDLDVAVESAFKSAEGVCK